jgi:hypothetical protein
MTTRSTNRPLPPYVLDDWSLPDQHPPAPPLADEPTEPLLRGVVAALELYASWSARPGAHVSRIRPFLRSDLTRLLPALPAGVSAVALRAAADLLAAAFARGIPATEVGVAVLARWTADSLRELLAQAHRSVVRLRLAAPDSALVLLRQQVLSGSVRARADVAALAPEVALALNERGNRGGRGDMTWDDFDAAALPRALRAKRRGSWRAELAFLRADAALLEALDAAPESPVNPGSTAPVRFVSQTTFAIAIGRGLPSPEQVACAREELKGGVPEPAEAEERAVASAVTALLAQLDAWLRERDAASAVLAEGAVWWLRWRVDGLAPEALAAREGRSAGAVRFALDQAAAHFGDDQRDAFGCADVAQALTAPDRVLRCPELLLGALAVGAGVVGD